jgi:hypothetical protein
MKFITQPKPFIGRAVDDEAITSILAEDVNIHLPR